MRKHLLTVRRALIGDADAIARIQVDAWQTAYRGMIPDTVLDVMTVDERTERWTNILSNPLGITLVAEVDSEVVAWTGFGRPRGDDVPQGRGEIYGFYVAPSHWRSGVGSAMWREVCGELRAAGFETAELWVLEANDAARRFYQVMGCSLADGAVQQFEVGGESAPEVKYTWRLGQLTD
jgi:ribosomal protein S18 acetylase RimI-like enzyme